MDGAADAPAVDATAMQARCPHCAASLRPSAPWCTLCWADLRPAPEPAEAPPVPDPPQLSAPYAMDPLTAPLAQVLAAGPVRPSAHVETALAIDQVEPEPTWPCTTCGRPNPLQAQRCEDCGNTFLAAVRAGEGPLLALPLVGDVLALTRAQRLALAGAVVLACVLMTLLLGAVLR